MRQLVLWDVDGTLVDFQGLGSSIYADAFRAATGEELRHQPVTTGRTEWAIIDALLAVHGIQATDDLRRSFFDAIDQATMQAAPDLAARGKVLPGVATVLTHLARLDVVQSLATGNTPTVAHIKLNVLRVGHQLDLKIGSYGTDSPYRPDLVKHAINRATEHRGAIPGATIVVGDTPWDIDAARAHGVVAVGIATGAFNEEELDSSGATLTLPALGTPQHRQRLYDLLGIDPPPEPPET